jgi:oligoribonuclease
VTETEAEVPARSADNLIWIDLEFSDLDPTRGGICQASMIVTTGGLQPLPPGGIAPKVGGLLYDVRITDDQAKNASEWVKANQKDQLVRSTSEEAFPVEIVEEFFVAYLLTTCAVPDNKALRPMLSGNSVHGDLRYIKEHMPRLDELLSFRLIDVTTLKELARRWCPKQVFSKNAETIRQWYPGEIDVVGAAHNALYDIKGSIAELAFYRKHLFGKVAHAGKRPT